MSVANNLAIKGGVRNAERGTGFASLHYAHTDKNIIIFLVSGALAE